MLSIQHCRELVTASDDLGNDELAAIREALYSLAALTFDAVFENRKRPRLRLVDSDTAFKDALPLIPDDQRDAIEERAAILEYDANLPRDEAERTAIAMLIQRD